MADPLAAARRAHYQDRDVARAWIEYERAVAELDRAGEQALAAEAVTEQANLRCEQGWWSDAVALVHDAKQRAARSGQVGLGVLLDALTGEIALRSGDRDGAARAFARGLETAERTGKELGRIAMQSARTFQDDGDLDEAARRLDRAVIELERTGDTRRANLARTRRALVALEHGEVDRAIAALEVVRAVVASDPLVAREASLYAAAAYAYAGRFADASRALAAAREVPDAWSSSRHGRHVVTIFEALVAAARGDDGAVARAAEAALAAEAPGADGTSAVNCFYIVRACVRLIRRLVPEARPIGKTRVAANGTWFQLVDGRTVELAHRPILARLLAALAATPAVASVAALLAAAWPNQTTVGTSGELRVYTSISRLRKLGLREQIVAEQGGYRLDAEISSSESA